MEILKVSTKSNPNAVAGVIAEVIRKEGSAVVQVIGAGALNQAVKAVAIARGYLATMGYDIAMAPAFTDIEIGSEKRTAIRLSVQPRKRCREK